MAEHFYPYRDGKTDKKGLLTYINTPELMNYAKNGLDLLQNFHDLTVWKVQCKHPSRMKNNAWYVGFVDREEPYLMNFTITPSNLNIEFRFSQYLPASKFEELKWQTKSWRCADLKSFGKKYVISLIQAYLINIKGDFYSGRLKVGGRSFVEDLIFRDLKQVYNDGINIERNKRPDNLRSDKDKPLELDIFLPEIGIAIEVQGPQHFKSIYGDNRRLKDNDKVKKEWCEKNGIKLIWVSWEGYNEHMLKKRKHERTLALKNEIEKINNSDTNFYFWLR